jgi:hypothetical protein
LKTEISHEGAKAMQDRAAEEEAEQDGTEKQKT